MYGFNSSWLLLMIVSTVLGLATQGYINATYRKWSRVQVGTGATGASVARAILDSNGLGSVGIQQVAGNLTDHYDPRTKTLGLSEGVFGVPSVAAAGVAAHEAGHAVQDAQGYVWGRVRGALVPVAQFGSMSAIWFIIIGLWVNFLAIAWVGIAFYAGAVLFQVVTLPVEFDASRRAIAALETSGQLSETQLGGAKQVLFAAALTYVAGALIAALQLLYFIGMARRD
jgi:Zn-dependent membrane protease YugP